MTGEAPSATAPLTQTVGIVTALLFLACVDLPRCRDAFLVLHLTVDSEVSFTEAEDMGRI
jgi:hypothetical protein